MKITELKDTDIDRMRALNAKNGYGLDNIQMTRLINNHEKGDTYKRSLIEYRLTDINFHHEVSLLMAGRYNELREEIEQW